MKRVTGIGGVFFKAQDKATLLPWYREHLGIDTTEYGSSFLWREHGAPDRTGYTVWGVFERDTEYFGSADQPYMVNFRVDDLVSLIAALKEEGVEVVGAIEQHENGKFAWIRDPEGRRVELWEPVDPKDDPYL